MLVEFFLKNIFISGLIQKVNVGLIQYMELKKELGIGLCLPHMKIGKITIKKSNYLFSYSLFLVDLF